MVSLHFCKVYFTILWFMKKMTFKMYEIGVIRLEFVLKNNKHGRKLACYFIF